MRLTFLLTLRTLSASFLGLALVASVSPVAAQSGAASYTFDTLAGATGEADSRDGAARSARFLRPRGVAVDFSGNVYVVDSQNSVIRRISATGSVTTLAGRAGEVGLVNGSGGSARFARPTAIAIDGEDNLYVADTYNHVIRRISRAGAVSTLAGSGEPGADDGRGTAAEFNLPTGLAVDSSGAVYVADTGNHTIRRIAPNGAVTTMAGSAGSIGFADGVGAAARFYEPTGVAVDVGGNVYVTDSRNSTVRRVAANGEVTTVAGSAGRSGYVDAVGAEARFTDLLSIAIDEAGNLYVGDGTAVRQIAVNRTVQTWAGTPWTSGSADGTDEAALFSHAAGLAVGTGGDLYVADTYNNTVRRITAAGNVSTVAGTAPTGSNDGTGEDARFRLPKAVAVDRSGNVYVADHYNHTIRKVGADGRTTTLAGAAGRAGTADGAGDNARFFAPSAVAVDAAGNVFVADTANHAIRRITPAGVVSTFAGEAGAPGSNDGSARNARFDHPTGLAIDSAGNLYVADQWNHSIRRITSGGTVSTYAGRSGVAGTGDGSRTNARFSLPVDVALDADGNVFVSDGSHTVRRISEGGAVTTFAGRAGQIGSNDATGDDARFNSPAGLAVDAKGHVFVADSGNQTLRRISPEGVVTTVGGAAGEVGHVNGPGTAARFFVPTDVAVSASGVLYVADSRNDAVRLGVLQASNGPVILNQPYGQSSLIGGTATFTVTAANATAYQWYKDGAAIAGATSATLTLTAVEAAQAGNYHVVITGPGGATVQSRTVVLSVDAVADAKLVNISTRAFVGTGSEVLIAGFVLQGSGPKTVLLRASGPALTKLNVTGVLSDPKLTLHDRSAALTSNENWGDDAAQKAAILEAAAAAGAFAWDEGSKDAAILTTLNPGLYTAIVDGNGGTGVALVEAYEVDLQNKTAKLINISTRSSVRTGANIQIAGFVIKGTGPKRVLIRASGPSLAQHGLTGLLADPVLEISNGNFRIESNDSWDVALRPTFQSLGIDNWEPGSSEAALVLTLSPGAYTAAVFGAGETSGIGRIEVFELP